MKYLKWFGNQVVVPFIGLIIWCALGMGALWVVLWCMEHLS